MFVATLRRNQKIEASLEENECTLNPNSYAKSLKVRFLPTPHHFPQQRNKPKPTNMKSNEKIIKKVWVTKYLFTKGIFEYEAETSDGKYFHTPYSTSRGISDGWMDLHGDECHETKEEAVLHARKMIAKKRLTIQKQLKAIDKLEASL